MSIVLACFGAFLVLAFLARETKVEPSDAVANGVPLVSATGITVYADGQILIDGGAEPERLLDGLLEAKRIVTLMRRQGGRMPRAGEHDHRALVLDGILIRLALAIRTVHAVIRRQASEDAA